MCKGYFSSFMLSDLLKIAIVAALKAGEQIMAIYTSNDFEVNLKSDNSPLTRADIAAHDIIVNELECTNIPVLSEEGKNISYEERKNWEVLWIVDPIDGTKEFINRNGEFTVNIALIQDNLPVAGVVYAPALNELYFSNVEIGSYELLGKLNIEELDLSYLIAQSVHLPKSRVARESNKFVVVASRSHMSIETEEFIDELKRSKGEVELISRGSSLKLCMVANGTADCYPRFAPTMEWDTAAGQAICLHANFNVIDWVTKETMKYNRKELLNNWFLVQ